MTTEQKTRQGVFWAVTIGYGLFYVCRLSINVLKKAMVEDGFLSESQLGIIGSALFFSYAVGKLVNGFLADRVNVRYFMSGALLICALVNAALSINLPFWLFVGLWALNGWFQSCGAPCSVIALKQWFSGKNYGTMYGFWSASHNLGEAITFIFIAFVVGALGWRMGFISASILGLLGAAMIFFLLRQQPSAAATNLSAREMQKSIGKKQAEVIRMPIIWVLALASAFMYIARYAVNSWGIFYLEAQKSYTTVQAASLVSISSVFGIIGTIGSGLVSDKVFKGDRVLMAVITSVLNLTSLAMFLFVPEGHYVLDVATMVLFGLSIGVLICFLGGLMAVDVAPAGAVGAAVGVIGIASYAAAGIQDILSGFLIEGRKVMNDAGIATYDFSAIRFFWIAAAALSLLLLLALLFRKRRINTRLS
jgi:OPA family sugar phosphate sensor protein UhpC-like MFS transporter